MELIKLRNGLYLVKDSNGRVIDEKEKKELEKRNLIVKDFESNKCQKETTKKLKKLKKEVVNEPIEETTEFTE